MSWKRGFVIALAAAAAVSPAAAQDGQLLLVEHFEVAPGDALAFEEVARTFVDAAEAGSLEAGRYGWLFWQNGFQYTVVFPLGSMAMLDDDQWWLQGFVGTAGEAGMQEAFGRMEDVDFQMTTEVLRSEPALSYAPEEPREARYAQVVEEWVDPGSASAYAEFVGGMATWLEEAEYPFEVQTYTTAVGPQRWIFVIFYDDPAEFAEWDARITEGPGAEEMVREWGPMILRYEEERIRYRPELSYPPSGR